MATDPKIIRKVSVNNTDSKRYDFLLGRTISRLGFAQNWMD